MSTTPWSEAVTSALTYIDDIRLAEELGTNAALFYRRMINYVQGAIPMCNRPPEFNSYITKTIVEPSYADYEWVSTSESLLNETVLDTGLTDFELFSCCVREVDALGNVTLTPYSLMQYNADTGEITIPAQESEGIEYVMDFYTDGTFPELDLRQKRILGLAIALVWDERFERNWLNMQMKIKDQSFSTVNESNYIEKSSRRLMDNTQKFNDEIRKYEQDVAYNKVVRNIRAY